MKISSKKILTIVAVLLVLFIVACSDSPTKFSVTFNTDGGSSVTAQSVEDGKYATKPANPTKSNCTFENWYKDSAKTVVFVFEEEKITADTEIYAKWTINLDGLQGSYLGIGEYGGDIPLSKYWKFEVTIDGLGAGFVSAYFSDDQTDWTSLFGEDNADYPENPCPITYTKNGSKLVISVAGNLFDMFDISVNTNGSLHIKVYDVETDLAKV